MYFEIVGVVEAVESIATGSGVRQIEILQEEYGGRRWSKMKGDRYGSRRGWYDSSCRASLV